MIMRLMINMSSRDDIEEFFDKMAKDRDETIEADTIVDYEQRLRQHYILELLDLNASDIVVDAGCGNCRDAEFFISSSKTRPQRYIAVDLARNMIMGCKKQPHSASFSLIQCDLVNIPLRTGTATKLICSEVLEHIPGWDKVIGELHRIVRPGGVIIVSTPNIYSMYYPQKKVLEQKEGTIHPHDIWKSYWRLKQELMKAGFEVTDIRGSCYLPGLLSYRGRTRSMMEKILGKLERLEKKLIGISPLRYFGYTIIIKAKKQ